MFDPKFFDDLAKRLSDVLPPSLRDMQADLERNFRAVLQGAFAKLDLVTRDEFDAQTKVLARTRKKLDAMERQLADLEQHLPKKAKPAATGKAKKS